jgi:hypothetical protein
MKSSTQCNESFTVLKTKFFMRLGMVLGQVGALFSKIPIALIPKSGTKVLIEAGKPGWESVFFVELRESLIDYLSMGKVESSTIDKNHGYLLQAIRGIIDAKPTHYCFDPRTGSQNRFRALFDTSILTFFLALRRVTPIVILTDGSIRLWRFQSFLLTGHQGLIVTFLDVNSMGPLFTHNRIIGPSLMPISQKRISTLSAVVTIEDNTPPDFKSIFFLGSLYPQRSEFLNELRGYMISRNCNVELIVEEKSIDVSIDSYWKKISLHSCLITTTMQQPSSKYLSDRLYVDQMVFRISEALAAGKLLICPRVPGMEKFFEENQHYVGYTSAADAADKIVSLSNNPEIRKRISAQGKQRYSELSAGHVFWEDINQKLSSRLT